VEGTGKDARRRRRSGWYRWCQWCRV